ncbi:MAG: hypothetical protein IKN89_00240 [Oscillospiraceae bacterium]|nr:hypothetical protein [Oscillospiraceae bacterium]
MDVTMLTGSYEIMDGEERAGTLEVSRLGGYFRFRAACRAEGGELLRLAVRSGEKTADLGVLAPEEGWWRLDKRFSPAALRGLGIGEICACFLRREAPAGWAAEPAPGRLLTDGLLRRLCTGFAGALTRREGENTLLALPLTEPFPLMPVFCLGTLRQLEGRPYLIFGIFNGKPGMIPPSEGQDRRGEPQIR